MERVLGDRKVAPLKRLRGYFEELISMDGQKAAEGRRQRVPGGKLLLQFALMCFLKS
jgi:hypothetical protein